MKKEDFERQFAEKSGIPLETLHELGIEAVRCDCGYVRCQGWTMESKPVRSQPASVDTTREA